jgi:tRNA uridine 5-carboxymethylaminomethyl modification enzyme
MFTSRAEFRLLLRHDNADRRLTPVGRRLGLVPDHRWQLLQRKERDIASGKQLLETNRHDNVPLAKILRRPEADWQDVAAHHPQLGATPPEVAQQIVFDVKYEGYVQRQMQEVQRHQRLAQKRIPANLDYDRLLHLRAEAKQQLARIRPVSVDQACRISGITPADIALLLAYLEGPRQA